MLTGEHLPLEVLTKVLQLLWYKSILHRLTDGDAHPCVANRRPVCSHVWQDVWRNAHAQGVNSAREVYRRLYHTLGRRCPLYVFTFKRDNVSYNWRRLAFQALSGHGFCYVDSAIKWPPLHRSWLELKDAERMVRLKQYVNDGLLERGVLILDNQFAAKATHHLCMNEWCVLLDVILEC